MPATLNPGLVLARWMKLRANRKPRLNSTTESANLQRDEAVAQIPAADGERGLALFHGEAEIGARAAQRGHQGGEEQRASAAASRVKKQAAVVLEMEFEWKVVSRRPANVAELFA